MASHGGGPGVAACIDGCDRLCCSGLALQWGMASWVWSACEGATVPCIVGSHAKSVFGPRCPHGEHGAGRRECALRVVCTYLLGVLASGCLCCGNRPGSAMQVSDAWQVREVMVERSVIYGVRYGNSKQSSRIARCDATTNTTYGHATVYARTSRPVTVSPSNFHSD